jgi:MFS family permease
VEHRLKQTFSSFEVRNFRLYFFGQGLSLCGTWMQTVALTWLVLKLTHSGTQLGLVIAAQFLPVLIFGLWGGVIADRFNKRRILYVTQTLLALDSLALGLLVVTDSVQLWMVYALAVFFGLMRMVDTPTRQSFIVEMVGRDRLKNAVTLNSTMVNAARVVGPSIAGFVIALSGVGACFLIDAVSYLAILITLQLMDASQLKFEHPVGDHPGQIRAGLNYVRQTPILRAVIIMMFIIGAFTYEFPVILPLFATVTMQGDAVTYSALMAFMGLGAVMGGLYTAGRDEIGKHQLISAAILFGICILATAVAPNLTTAYITMVLVGFVSVAFVALGNTMLQLASKDSMRGRVMSLWSMGFQGTTPIGGPVIGYIADHANPRVGLAVGGVAALIAAALGRIAAE